MSLAKYAKYLNAHPVIVIASAATTLVITMGSVEFKVINWFANRELELKRQELIRNYSSDSAKLSFDVGNQGVVLTEDKISASPAELQGYRILAQGKIAVIEPRDAEGWEWSKKTERDLIREENRNLLGVGEDTLRGYKSFEADVFSRKTPVTVETEQATYTFRPVATFEFVGWDKLRSLTENYQRGANLRMAQTFFQGAIDVAQRACLRESSVAECDLRTANRLPAMIDDRNRYVESLNENNLKLTKLQYMAAFFWASILPLDIKGLGEFIPKQTSFNKGSMIIEGYYDLTGFKTTGGATRLYVMSLYFALDSGLYVATYKLPYSDQNGDPAMLRGLLASFKIVR